MDAVLLGPYDLSASLGKMGKVDESYDGFRQGGRNFPGVTPRIAPNPIRASGLANVVLKYPYFWGTTAGAAAAVSDIAPDGRRSLMIRPVKDSKEPDSAFNLLVVLNRFEELKKLVP